MEKRGGILKPQGSLERNRDSGELVNTTENNSQPSSARKPRQNVAMQAIMRRAESEQKQVTFKNVSPITDEIEKKKLSADSALHTANLISQPAKTNIKNSSVTSLMNNGNSGVSVITAPVVQPRPPLMPNAPLNVHKSVSVIQQQQQQQQHHQQAEQNKVRKIINFFFK